VTRARRRAGLRLAGQDAPRHLAPGSRPTGPSGHRCPMRRESSWCRRGSGLQAVPPASGPWGNAGRRTPAYLQVQRATCYGRTGRQEDAADAAALRDLILGAMPDAQRRDNAVFHVRRDVRGSEGAGSRESPGHRHSMAAHPVRDHHARCLAPDHGPGFRDGPAHRRDSGRARGAASSGLGLVEPPPRLIRP
jgi:hypothetical protein